MISWARKRITTVLVLRDLNQKEVQEDLKCCCTYKMTGSKAETPDQSKEVIKGGQSLRARFVVRGIQGVPVQIHSAGETKVR